VARARAAAADRALRALGSGAGPQAGSWAERDAASLTIPWRGHLADPAGEQPSTDGTAALSAILAGYGVNAGTEELTALAESWQGPWGPREAVRLTTLVRIASRGSLRPLGPAYGTGGDEWSAAVARDYLRRGYPILALVSPALLPGAPSDQALPDRYIALIGFEGDELVYHDPVTSDGMARRLTAVELDRAWSSAAPPRQGAAFGFGTNVIGLLNLLPRQAAPTATAAAPTATAIPQATPTPEPAAVARPVQQGVGDVHPLLLGFVLMIASGIGFGVSRLVR
jgi:hypothetical protein